jgi:predicted Zn-dependent protease
MMRAEGPKAIKYVQQGLDHYPYNATLKLMMVGALFSTGHPDDAEREARTLLTMYPEYGNQVDGIRRQYEALHTK